MPVTRRHQLAVCESEKKGSLCELETPPCWYSLSLSRPTCYLHEVPLVTAAGPSFHVVSGSRLHVREAPLKTVGEAAHAATAVLLHYRTAWWQLVRLCQITA